MTRYPNLLILLVEDDPLQATIGASRLKRNGYNVLTAHSGEDSIEKIKSNPEIQLILMDIDLGLGMDGTEAARIILQVKDVPILFLSGHSEEEYVNKVQNIPRYGYIVKNTGDFIIFSAIEIAMELFLTNQELKKADRRFNMIADNINEIFWIEDNHTNTFQYISPSFETVFGISRDEIYQNPRKILEFFHPDDLKMILEKQADFKLKNSKESVIHRIVRKDGSIRWIHVSTYPVFSKKGDVLHVVGFAEDITNLKTIEIQNANKSKELELILENLPIAAVLIDLQFTILEWNKAAVKTFGFSKEEAIGKNAFEFMIHPSDKEKVTQLPIEILKNIDSISLVNHNVTKDGRKILCEWLNTPIRNENNQLIGIIAIAQDITERTIGEEKILNRLEEREILLKEVHHRIKNNMASISSLLTLQADSVVDVQAKNILLDAKNRVTSMMVLYDKLFHTDNYRTTSLKSYLTSLLAEISVLRNNNTILLSSEIEDIELETSILFPIGIIVNELLTNSLKHGFKNRAQGKIEITGKRTDRSSYICIVEDDGVGWQSKESKGQKHSGFGIDLVKILTSQIKGKYQKENTIQGTKSYLEFPLPPITPY
jgi:PAS domain S-box-containing protein